MLAKLQPMISNRLHTSPSQIAEFCQKWRVVEFSLFGSVLREDFRSDSDIDVLVTLAPDHGLNLFDWIEMQRELEDLFQREVDLVDKQGLKNPFRRAGILSNYQVLYASERS